MFKLRSSAAFLNLAVLLFGSGTPPNTTTMERLTPSDHPAYPLVQSRMLIALLMLAISITSCALDTAQLTFHEPPKLANIPGTTEISATWSRVSNVTHYQVRWTLDNPSIEIQEATNLQEPKATFSLPQQGLWTIEIRACIATRCGPPSGESILVIIDVLGASPSIG